jgi:uncharacterized membrane protein
MNSRTEKGHTKPSVISGVQRIRGLSARFSNALPALYIPWSLPFLLTLSLLTPPFQNPDEVNHYLRAVQIARGELIGYRLLGPNWVSPPNSGGHSDPGVIAASEPFAHVKFNQQQQIHKSDFSAVSAMFFGADELIGFGNTAAYAPFLYLPSVVAIWIGQAARIPILTTLNLSRAANGIIALLISSLAISLACRTRWVIAALAMLPMTSALYASANQDALIISLSLLLVGIIDRIGAERRGASRVELTAVFLLASLIGLARPPYGVLALLPLAISIGSGRRELWVFLGIVSCVAAWTIFSMKVTSVNMNGADPGIQITHILQHPFDILPIAWRTISEFSENYFREFIGVLGWLDTVLPNWFVRGAGIALAASLLGVCASTPGPRPWLAFLIAVLGSGAIFGTQYLTWTRPLAPFVDGVQGRYFIPLAPVGALSLPAAPKFIRPVLPWLSMAGIIFLAILAPAVVIRSIVYRYYLVG